MMKSLRQIWNQDKIIWVTIITLGVLFFPAGLIHELGHIIICVASGFNYTFSVGGSAFIVHCSDFPQPIQVYWAMGGIFGMIFSLVPVASKWVRENKGVFIGVVVTGFDHMQKAIFETTTHFSYLSNTGLLVLVAVLDLVLMCGLLRHFGYRPFSKTGNHTN